MRRRTVLATLCSTASLSIAGCLGGDSDSSDDPSPSTTETSVPPDTTNAQTQTEEPTEDSPLTYQVNGRVESRSESSVLDREYLHVEIENVSEQKIGRVKAKNHLLDEDGAVGETVETEVGSLEPGEVWHAFPLLQGDKMRDPSDHEFRIRYASEPPETPNLSIKSSQIVVGEDAPHIEGAVENEGDEAIQYPNIHGKFYSDGEIVGVGVDHISAVQPDLPASFDVGYYPWDFVQRPVKDHEIVVQPLVS